MSSRLRLVALAAVLTASMVATPAVALAAGAAKGGSHSVVATKKKSGKSTRPKKKANPTPLWSLYPLTAKASPEPTPQTDQEALSTPPVKPTEQGAEPAAPASTRAAEEGDNGLPGSVVLAVVAGILVLVLLLSVWVSRRGRRSRPQPVRPAPAAATRATAGRARPAPTRSEVAPSNGVVTAPPVTTGPASARPAPAAAEAAPAPQAAAPSSPRPAESGPKEAPPASIDLPETPRVEPREKGPAETPDEVSLEAQDIPKAGTGPAQADVGEETGRGQAPAAGDRAAAAPPVDREHVRVHLVDGRLIEGWKRGRYSRDNRVLVLDVERVLDAGGHEIASTPLDSFLLPPQIDIIEPIGEPRPEASTARGAAGRALR